MKKKPPAVFKGTVITYASTKAFVQLRTMFTFTCDTITDDLRNCCLQMLRQKNLVLDVLNIMFVS